MRRFPGVLHTIVYAAAVLVATGLVAYGSDPLGAARLAGGLALTTLLPGFALSKVLFPGRFELTLAERLALAVGGSVALVVLLVFALDAGPTDIARGPLMAALPALCLVLGAAAFVRGRFADTDGPRRTPSARGDGLPFALVSLGLVAVVTGFWSVLQVVDRPVAATEFYLVDDLGRLASPPSSWSTGDRLELVLGVTSHEPEPTRFRIEVADERTLHTTVLQPGSSWQARVSFIVTPAMEGRIPIELYREDERSEPYRRLYLTAQPGAGP